MNVPTITMDQAEASRQLEAYRESVRRRHDEEHEALVRAYEALAEGTPLLQLEEAISQGGFHDDGRPRLAVARSDRRHVTVSCQYSETHRIRFNTSPQTRAYDTLIIRAGTWSSTRLGATPRTSKNA